MQRRRAGEAKAVDEGTRRQAQEGEVPSGRRLRPHDTAHLSWQIAGGKLVGLLLLLQMPLVRRRDQERPPFVLQMQKININKENRFSSNTSCLSRRLRGRSVSKNSVSSASKRELIRRTTELSESPCTNRPFFPDNERVQR